LRRAIFASSGARPAIANVRTHRAFVDPGPFGVARLRLIRFALFGARRADARAHAVLTNECTGGDILPCALRVACLEVRLTTARGPRRAVPFAAVFSTQLVASNRGFPRSERRAGRAHTRLASLFAGVADPRASAARAAIGAHGFELPSSAGIANTKLLSNTRLFSRAAGSAHFGLERRVAYVEDTAVTSGCVHRSI
jgi:hypothetical protein